MTVAIDGIAGFLKRSATKFGSGAEVDCPKEHIGREINQIIKCD